MKTFYQNPAKLDTLIFNNYKSKETSSDDTLIQLRKVKKPTHKKGYSELQETNLNFSIQTKPVEFKKIVPKFLQNKSTLQKQSNNSNFCNQSNQNHIKKVELNQRPCNQNKFIEQTYKKTFFQKNFVQDQNIIISKVDKQKVLEKRFNIDQVYEIKQKIQKIRNQVGLNNFNKIPQEGYTKNIKNQQHKNNERSHFESKKLKKPAASFTPNLPKLPLCIQDFQCLQNLGSGVYGQVSLYRHLKTNFIVAIKKISKRSLDSQKESIYLSRQIKIHASADHPNIVQMYAFFDDLEHIYLVMEVCNQGNLLSIMRNEGGRLPEEKVRRYMRNVSKALQFLHDENIIHRDIKPQNILVSNGIAKICDFGWSVNTIEMRSTLCGTPLYSSPQIVKCLKYDRKVDIWCIGIMTYELIYGRTPFEIRSREDLMKVVDCQVYFPSNREISEDCKNFIEGCLKKNVNQRFEIEDVLGHPFMRDDEKIRDSLKASFERDEKTPTRS